jgi:hypothetical protein
MDWQVVFISDQSRAIIFVAVFLAVVRDSCVQETSFLSNHTPASNDRVQSLSSNFQDAQSRDVNDQHDLPTQPSETSSSNSLDLERIGLLRLELVRTIKTMRTFDAT